MNTDLCYHSWSFPNFLSKRCWYAWSYKIDG